MGLEKAIEFWKASEEAFDMILMTDDDKVYVTEALADHFETSYELEVIKK